MRATGPDLCGGGVGGYVVLRGYEVSSPNIKVNAIFVGTKKFLPSMSGSVNPERVTAAAPVSS